MALNTVDMERMCIEIHEWNEECRLLQMRIIEARAELEALEADLVEVTRSRNEVIARARACGLFEEVRRIKEKTVPTIGSSENGKRLK
ncbi:hypothetical protein [Paenibacillus flagellatus]|uniref:Uncharacterized protein n=1 Tax=Paenibacillus flagellatus TaxID=2211139 RepID=A0A2V5K5G0_9BACL|nr:hypothetical protein [Paenibacillus flagellatus]PYI54498.1 hypothetical protein DLM86_13615 [Paenibacillus flagellatus]